MSKPENKIYTYFNAWVKRDGFLHVFSDIHFHRIESPNTELGIPDIYHECKRFHGWVEMKYIEWPVRKSTTIKIKWQPRQMQWLINNVERTYGAAKTCLAVIDNYNVIRLFDVDHLQREYTQEEFKKYGTIVKTIKEVIFYLSKLYKLMPA